jgi:hypothetical protein
MKIIIVVLAVLCVGLLGYGYLNAHPETWDQLVAQCSQGPAPKPAVLVPELAPVGVVKTPEPSKALQVLQRIDIRAERINFVRWVVGYGDTEVGAHTFDIICRGVSATGATFEVALREAEGVKGWGFPTTVPLESFSLVWTNGPTVEFPAGILTVKAPQTVAVSLSKDLLTQLAQATGVTLKFRRWYCAGYDNRLIDVVQLPVQ